MTRAVLVSLLAVTLVILSPSHMWAEPTLAPPDLTEREPDDDAATATPLPLDKVLEGTWGPYDTKDWYRVELPSGGLTTLTLTEAPSDATFQIGLAGFRPGGPSGGPWLDTTPGKPVTAVIASRGGEPGWIWLRVTNPGTGPAPLRYRLRLSHQAVPGAGEPDERAGLRPADLLAAGLLQTLEPGRPVKAWLMGETPGFVPGTPNASSDTGGADDVDTFHVRLDAPDEVTAEVTDLAPGSFQLTLFVPGGWEQSPPGQTRVTARVSSPGDVFVEVRRAPGAPPLPPSATPYGVVVTTPSHPAAALPADAVASSSGSAPAPFDDSLETALETWPLLADERAAVEAYGKAPSAEGLAKLAAVHRRQALYLGTEALRAGDSVMYDRALAAGEAAVEEEPGNAEGWLILARIHGANADNPTALLLAEDEARRAVELAPGSTEARLLLVAFLMERRRYGAAQDEIMEALKIDPTLLKLPGLVVMLTRTYLADGLVAEARDFFTEALKTYPDAAACRVGLAACSAATGGSAAAAAELRGLAENPATPPGTRETAQAMLAALTGQEVVR